MTQAYPLHWPPGFPRITTPEASRFKTSISGSIKNVMTELQRFGNDSKKSVSNIVISANVSLMDQHPRDGAIACYFRWDNMDCCIAVDKYKWPEENLQAIALIIDAERTKLRHGGLNIVRASFRGFTALPPPKDGKYIAPKTWWEVLGFDKRSIALADAESAYRKLVKSHHPDKGGDPAQFNQIADAIRQAREELK